MKRIRIFAFGIFVCLVTGCGQREARNQLREALAMMKVCTKGADYTEFHQKRQEVETRIELYKHHARQDFRRLTELMNACDVCWDWNVYVLTRPIPTPADWEALKTISPNVTNVTHASDYTSAAEIWKREAQEVANLMAKLRVQLDGVGQIYGENPADRLSAKIDRDWEKTKRQDRRPERLSALPDPANPEYAKINSRETDPSTHVRRALTLIQAECDRLLGQLQ
jgi:hypothetical protein